MDNGPASITTEDACCDATFVTSTLSRESLRVNHAEILRVLRDEKELQMNLPALDYEVIFSNTPSEFWINFDVTVTSEVRACVDYTSSHSARFTWRRFYGLENVWPDIPLSVFGPHIRQASWLALRRAQDSLAAADVSVTIGPIEFLPTKQMLAAGDRRLSARAAA